MFSKKHYFANLKTNTLGYQFSYFESLASTNDLIWEVNAPNPINGQCILAEEQTRGRGRRGNTWKSTPGKSLTFSIIIDTPLQPEQFGLISLVAGISVANAIKECTNLRISLKWPNDILLNEKKTGGILTESRKINSQYKIAIGVGLNVNEIKIPLSLKNVATSLKLESKKNIKRELLLANILNNLESDLHLNAGEISYKWAQYCIHNNKTVSFHFDKSVISGKFKGITDNGHAVLDIAGEKKIFSAGVIEI